MIYDHNVSDSFGYSAKLSYDFVSSASIERLSEFDGQSGASRDNYVGADVAFRHILSDSELLGWHVHYSNEYDYNSFGLGGNWVVSPKGTDATVSLSLDGFYDLVDVIRFDGSEEDTEARASLAATVQLVPGALAHAARPVRPHALAPGRLPGDAVQLRHDRGRHDDPRHDGARGAAR